MVELSRKLAGSPAVSQCFVRHTFRFLMGREEVERAARAITAAQQAFATRGDFVQMVAALYTSKPFLHRSAK